MHVYLNARNAFGLFGVHMSIFVSVDVLGINLFAWTFAGMYTHTQRRK